MPVHELRHVQVQPVRAVPETLLAPRLQLAITHVSEHCGYPLYPETHSLQSAPVNGNGHVPHEAPVHWLRHVHVHEGTWPLTTDACPLQLLAVLQGGLQVGADGP